MSKQLLLVLKFYGLHSIDNYMKNKKWENCNTHVYWDGVVEILINTLDEQDSY